MTNPTTLFSLSLFFSPLGTSINFMWEALKANKFNFLYLFLPILSVLSSLLLLIPIRLSYDFAYYSGEVILSTISYMGGLPFTYLFTNGAIAAIIYFEQKRIIQQTNIEVKKASIRAILLTLLGVVTYIVCFLVLVKPLQNVVIPYAPY